MLSQGAENDIYIDKDNLRVEKKCGEVYYIELA